MSWTEKRRSPRVNTKVPLRYQVRGNPEHNSALSGDISACGMGFINAGFIAPNNYLNIEINLMPRVITTTAKVVRAETFSHSDKYWLGVDFSELDIRQRQFLTDYVNQHI